MFNILAISTKNFMTALKIMGFGMVGIFLVIGIIMGVTVLLAKMPEKKDKPEE